MKFETKYNLGDTVFVLHENKIVQGTIYKIYPSHVSGTGKTIGDSDKIDMNVQKKDEYALLKLVDVKFTEDQLFDSRKQLIASL